MPWQRLGDLVMDQRPAALSSLQEKKKRNKNSNPRKAADEKQYLTLFLCPIFHWVLQSITFPSSNKEGDYTLSQEPNSSKQTTKVSQRKRVHQKPTELKHSNLYRTGWFFLYWISFQKFLSWSSFSKQLGKDWEWVTNAIWDTAVLCNEYPSTCLVSSSKCSALHCQQDITPCVTEPKPPKPPKEIPAWRSICSCPPPPPHWGEPVSSNRLPFLISTGQNSSLLDI